VCPCVEYVSIIADGAGTFNYEDCFGTPKSVSIVSGPNVFIGLDDPACLNRNSLSADVPFTVEAFGPCCTPTPSTTTTSTTPPITGCKVYTINAWGGGIHSVEYIPCGAVDPLIIELGPTEPSTQICAENPLISDNQPAYTTEGGSCSGDCNNYSWATGAEGGSVIVTDCLTGVISNVPYGPELSGTFCATSAGAISGDIIVTPAGLCP
jgi:hypothetical protein